MESRRFDGVELLRKLRDKEINLDTKIRSMSACGNEYNITINAGADKFIFDGGEKVSTGYLSNSENKFEIIEEDKKIEKIDVIPYEKCIHEVTHKEKEILLEIRDIQMKVNKIIDCLMENKDV